jgi:hypothetical protein
VLNSGAIKSADAVNGKTNAQVPATAKVVLINMLFMLQITADLLVEFLSLF